MKTNPRLKKEVISLVGGTLLAYTVAALCGINKTAFATAPSTFGVILLILASRGFVAALADKAFAPKRSA